MVYGEENKNNHFTSFRRKSLLQAWKPLKAWKRFLGLKEGEDVVVKGKGALKDGLKVRNDVNDTEGRI